MTFRLQKIDELTLNSHFHLAEDDICLYFGEYTAEKGFAFSDTNNLILNLKKDVLRKDKPEYKYKQMAIKKVANFLSKYHDYLLKCTFVPVPPSRCKSDERYDDRLINILNECKKINPTVDFRELITQRETLIASHNSSSRPSYEELANNYEFHGYLANNIRSTIIIFDDVLTAGSHYKAMKTVIKQHIPDVQIIGLFIARTVRNIIDDFDVIDF
ncbi:hypothetical protein QE177_04660 [Arsenophonus sp. aPb]|uniref:hypothetical protein n=1 Tax=Arsenophonus sp. aPb TaxID=3041619 RepID=UPI0024693864|nr:hypothetical protein [Arsenophonus sp. aPb]WGL99177.1 hypothetical protein QE177_04660 [Arsenophonus sp. aPb]